jgi:prepilin-type processing-associated H-X9-DG protein
MFLCPSTPDTELHSNKPAFAGAAFTDYGGIYGVEGMGRNVEQGNSSGSDVSTGNPDPQPTQTLRDESLGVMIYEVPVAANEVTDGLSNTTVVGEFEFRRLQAVDEWAEWVNGLNIFAQEQSTPINGKGLGNETGSPHPGGAALVFCDAHVKFVAETIEQSVLNAMLTKAGGERP